MISTKSKVHKQLPILECGYGCGMLNLEISQRQSVYLAEWLVDAGYVAVGEYQARNIPAAVSGLEMRRLEEAGEVFTFMLTSQRGGLAGRSGPETNLSVTSCDAYLQTTGRYRLDGQRMIILGMTDRGMPSHILWKCTHRSMKLHHGSIISFENKCNCNRYGQHE